MTEAHGIESDNREHCRIDLGNNGGTSSFYTRDDALNWIDTEIAAWEWVKAPIAVDKSPQRPLQQLKSRLMAAELSDQSFWDILNETIVEIFKSPNNRVNSNSIFGRFLIQLQNTNLDEAIWALATRTSEGSIQRFEQWKTARSVILGTARALIFDLGLNANANLKIAEGIQEEWSARLDGHSKKLSGLQSSANDLKNDFAKTIALSNDQISEDHKAWEKQIESHKAAMSAIEKEWAERVKMRAAVEYWGDRKSRQAMWSIVWATASIVLMGIAIYWLNSGRGNHYTMPTEVIAVLDEVRSKKIEGSIATLILTQSFIRSAAPIVLPAMLFVWVLRIVVRNYVSASHLMTDAGEREILIQTYLALSTDKDLANIPEIRDKALPQMLASVFRHTADGLVKDDGLPTQAIVDLAKGK